MGVEQLTTLLTEKPMATILRGPQHKVDPDPDSRDSVGYNEATRDPIFLLQKREVRMDLINGLSPDDWYSDGEDLYISADHFDDFEKAEAPVSEDWRDADGDFEQDGIRVTDQDLVDMGLADIHWRTEKVFFRRPEAEEYATANRHNLGRLHHGCRVYCVPTEGRLADILKVVCNKEIEEYIHTQEFKRAYASWRNMQNTMIGSKS